MFHEYIPYGLGVELGMKKAKHYMDFMQRGLIKKPN